jgi:microcompartment protein CcmL/EutN
MSDALACLELSSIARGVRVLDAIVKRAPVQLRHHGRHSCGKYVILVDGDVASVEESYEDALQQSGDALIDHMFLARAHERVWSALDGDYADPTDDAALMVETSSVACNVEALDFAVKLVDAVIVDLQLASGIGGKGYFALQAPQHDLEYARDELLVRLPTDRVVGIDLIARPHHEMLAAFGHAGPFER